MVFNFYIKITNKFYLLTVKFYFRREKNKIFWFVRVKAVNENGDK